MIFDALKELKKALKRNQSNSKTNLRDELLTSIVLLIALRRLTKNKSFKGLASMADHVLDKCSDQVLLACCRELYYLVSRFCPKEIENALPEPDLNSIAVVRQLLKKELVIALASDLSSIGFAYQIFNMTERQLALAAVQKANKVISKDQLIAFTQLYTPGWVVDFLVANTVSPLVPETISSDKRFSRWLLESKPNKVKSVQMQDVKLIDPACGAGHFLFAAFDLLLASYIEAGTTKKEAVHQILVQNLYGADIDSKALWLASLTILIKCLLLEIPAPDFRFSNLSWSDLSNARKNGERRTNDCLGSLSRQWLQEPDHPLGQNFQVVVTNPPYIGRKLLSRELKAALQEYYPDSHVDLCAAFVKRSLEMLAPEGRLGVITQASLLTLPSYKDIRAYVDQNYKVPMVVNCGTQVFPLATGEKIDSMLLIAESTAEFTNTGHRRGALHAPAAWDTVHEVSKEGVAQKEDPAACSIYLKLTDQNDKAAQLQQMISDIRSNRSTDDKSTALSIGSIIRRLSDNYLPDPLNQMVLNSPKLSTIAEVRQGLATTDNKRFVRYFWDVDARDLGKVWVPYSKGAGSERWHSDNNYVVKWGAGGREIKQAVSDAYPYLNGKTAWVVKNEEFYFRPGLCFSFVNKTRLAVRRLPSDCIFDVASSAIFPNGNADKENFLLAYLNSSIISTIANTINPTINLQVGDIKRLPIFDLSKEAQTRLSQLAKNCYDTKSSISCIQQLSDLGSSDTNLSIGLDIENAFNKIRNTLQGLEIQLASFEEEIDELMFAAIARLAARSSKAVDDLKNWTREHSNGNEISPSYSLTSSAFAARFLYERVSQLLSNRGKEQIIIHPLDHGANVGNLLGLQARSVAWLENALQKSLPTFFRKSYVVDLSKMAKTPARYFSIWLANSNCLLLLSSQAFRNSMKLLDNGDSSIWNKSKQIFVSMNFASEANDKLQPAGNVDKTFSSAIAESESLMRRTNSILSQQIDWTSKDLIEAVNQCAISIGLVS